jgi:hypothetical protein
MHLIAFPSVRVAADVAVRFSVIDPDFSEFLKSGDFLKPIDFIKSTEFLEST